MTLQVKEVTVTSTTPPLVAVVRFAEPINGHADRLRNTLREFYSRELNKGAPRLFMEIGDRKALFRLRADYTGTITEVQVRAALDYLEIGRVTYQPKETAKAPSPRFQRPRPQVA